MKNIFDIIPTDKLLHGSLACIIFLTSYDILHHTTNLSFLWNTVIAAAITIVLFILKEVYDLHQKGNHFCFYDVLADTIGLIYGLTLLITIVLL